MLEYFLPPFEESIRAGAVTVMVNPGDVNGIPGHANYHLLTEILKEQYDFLGFALSDWVRQKSLAMSNSCVDISRKISFV